MSSCAALFRRSGAGQVARPQANGTEVCREAELLRMLEGEPCVVRLLHACRKGACDVLQLEWCDADLRQVRSGRALGAACSRPPGAAATQEGKAATASAVRNRTRPRPAQRARGVS